MAGKLAHEPVSAILGRMKQPFFQNQPAMLMASLALLAGTFVPAFSLSAWPSAALAQTRVPLQASVPDDMILARLVWSSMLAVDNANRTGNYSVLRALGSPIFQRAYSQQDLATIFADLRTNRVDLGKALMKPPQYYFPPQIDAEGALRLRGWFNFSRQSLRFDMLFENIDGGWQITALSIGEFNPDRIGQLLK